MMEFAATSATDAATSAQDAVPASPSTIQQIMSEVARERPPSKKPASASMIAPVFTAVALAILVMMAFSIAS